ncbi:MAG: hypothetical protein EXR50_07630 [Dehalococcoidia bacterium]|nr:hypothetical protein [Dehalococcoidia bacterium]
MSRVSQLYDLQETDSEIMVRETALGNIEARLGESDDILSARQVLAEDRERAAALEPVQRDHEWQIDDFKTKISAVETKMYSGSVLSSRELTNLQEEVEALKRGQSRIDDALLVVLEQLEGLQISIRVQQSKLSQMEVEWDEEQQRLNAEKAKVNSELDRYKVRRSGQSSLVDPRDLSLYQSLIKGRGGRAVARVERNGCQGCRISIPLYQVQRARSGNEVVQCPSCERILYVN